MDTSTIPDDIWMKIFSDPSIKPENLYSLYLVNQHFHNLIRANNSIAFYLYNKLAKWILDIKAKDEHIFISSHTKDKNYSLRGKGTNSFGQLGIGTIRNSPKFEEISVSEYIKDVIQIATSSYNTCILGLDREGNQVLLGCGSNFYFQLNSNSLVDVPNFQKIQTPDGVHIKGIALGWGFILIWGKNEQGHSVVYGIGNNKFGQLGIKDVQTLDVFTPIALPHQLVNVDGVGAGDNHVLIYGRNLDNSPVLAGAGYNFFGQLGTGNTISVYEYTLIHLPCSIKKIQNIYAGNNSTIINATTYGVSYTSKPVVFASGMNDFGQLGVSSDKTTLEFSTINIPEELIAIVDICGGNTFSVLLGVDINQKTKIAISGALSHLDLFSPNYKFKICPKLNTINKIVGISSTDYSIISFGFNSENRLVYTTYGEKKLVNVSPRKPQEPGTLISFFKPFVSKDTPSRKDNKDYKYF